MSWIQIIIVSLCLTTANPVYADDDVRSFPMDLHDLGLTHQQHKSVEAAMKEYQHAYRRHHRQSEKTQDELNSLFLSPTFDTETFRTKNLEMERTSIEIRTRLFERLHKILTPEQKRRFIRHIKEWEVE